MPFSLAVECNNRMRPNGAQSWIMRATFNPFGVVRTNRAIGAIKEKTSDRIEECPMKTGNWLRGHIAQINDLLLIAIDGIPDAINESNGTAHSLFKVRCELGRVDDWNLHLILVLDFGTWFGWHRFHKRRYTQNKIKGNSVKLKTEILFHTKLEQKQFP